MSVLRTIVFLHLSLAAAPARRDAVAKKLAADYPSFEAIHQDLHAHPELSFIETRTAGIVATEVPTNTSP